jgi:DNA-binding NarL/FixJ family response regulator
MPHRTPEALIVCPQRLTRELLGVLLAQQCGLRVAGQFERLEDCRVPASARLLIWDEAGRSTDDHGRALNRLRAAAPALRIVTFNSQSCSLEEFVALVRGFIEWPGPVREQLTRPECEVLLGVAGGLRNSDIARRLRRSSKTVEKHRANLQRKLGLRNVAQLTAFAIQAGLLPADAILSGPQLARYRPAAR